MSLYVIQPEGEQIVKIGYTGLRVRDRVMALQGANHRKLKLIAYSPGTARDESFLHWFLREHHVHGEWFHLAPPVAKIVSKLAKGTYRTPAGRKFRNERKTEAGRKGGLANGRKRRKERMPKAMAIIYWRDLSLKNWQAIEKMNADPYYPGEWNESLAYRHLKKRGGVPGRRANQN